MSESNGHNVFDEPKEDTLGKYVRHRDSENGPIGRVDSQTYNQGVTTCHVVWGVMDGRTYADDFLEVDLVIVPTPVQPEEVLLRQAQEAGGRIEFEEEG